MRGALPGGALAPHLLAGSAPSPPPSPACSTGWVADAAVSWRSPSLSMVASTSRGATYVPWLAMVFIAAASWMAVTAMPWP